MMVMVGGGGGGLGRVVRAEEGGKGKGERGRARFFKKAGRRG